MSTTASSIITTTRTLSVWPLVPLPGTQEVTTTAKKAGRGGDAGGAASNFADTGKVGVCGAVFNVAFRYVISHEASTRSTVYLWNVDNGRLISQFHKAHGSNPITAICLDRENRRLFTGCHKGDVVKTWNFNNGSLLKVFSKVGWRRRVALVAVPIPNPRPPIMVTRRVCIDMPAPCAP